MQKGGGLKPANVFGGEAVITPINFPCASHPGNGIRKDVRNGRNQPLWTYITSNYLLDGMCSDPDHIDHIIPAESRHLSDPDHIDHKITKADGL